MEKLYDLKEKLTRELDEIAEKPELGAGDLELIHKLTDTIKNIDKICALEEQGGYSEAGDYEGGSYGNGSYGGGSYANRGKHYVRGHYSREGGGTNSNGSYDGGSYRGGSSNRGGNGGYSSRRGGGRGGYSRAEGAEEMKEHIRMAIESAPDEYREEIQGFLRELEG